MAKARALDKRRKSIRNIRKITRTMELIATARFKKAMDRATAATAYTRRITQIVANLAQAGLQVSHPLLEARPEIKHAALLVLTANRGLCGGYNGGVVRVAAPRYQELQAQSALRLEVAGKRGISGLRYRGVAIDETYLQFNDQPKFEEVEPIANRFLDLYTLGKLDRLDVAYTKFVSSSKQIAVVETLLPLGSLEGADAVASSAAETALAAERGESTYEFLPSAESILAEVVPASFKAKLFKCFLDAAVSEQIARMVAMKSATDNASGMIKDLSMTYNRARQSQITGEIMEIIGGVEALKGT
ncbi:MAG: ATP synthase F1 subunit gamma [Pirellulaceae bacterium]|jgi:F-type H+-transporting ATPase subunit gamma|nr:ATP synthase F1 subunit gamma [Pirellulaceae bacterium]